MCLMVPYPLQFTKINKILPYLFIQEFDVLRTRKRENEERDEETIKIMGLAIMIALTTPLGE